MKLKDNRFELDYDSNFDNDILNKFYIPALSSSIKYRRMIGFFRSSAFACAARGIASFINNKGKMQVLTSPDFSNEDIEILNKMDREDAKEYIVEVLQREINPESIQNAHTEAFGWMLANDQLEIRIVIVKNESGSIVPSDIFHNKIGILSDEENTLVFSGSINETLSGWMNNIEHFDVFCDWRDGVDRIDNKVRNFDLYWEIGETKRSVTMEFPDAVKNKWISSVPNNKEDLIIFRTTDKKTVIRPYQKQAINEWFFNNCRGIFNMATGTGKTITAVHALKRLQLEKKAGLTIVVVVPLQHLVDDPWIKTIKTELSSKHYEPQFIRAFDDSNKWMFEAKRKLEYYRFGVINNLTFVTTYDTFSSEKFINLIKSIKGEKVLIADEVHNSGSAYIRNGLLEFYDYRLGLSATPARYLDEEGTSFIMNYFGDEVFTFSLERAINEINPDTGFTYLTPYNYMPIFINLNDDEIDQYKKLSEKLCKFADNEKLTPEQLRIKTHILIKRSRILKNAAGKIKELESILPTLRNQGYLEYCLVYCSDGKDPDNEMKTLNKVIECLNEEGISNRRFTSKENQRVRKEILDSFANGDIRSLVAIKCLDEGVDVPATRNAIIMASTGNPREYIQRRGRVLRRFKNKEYATIFDFIIIPREDSNDLETEIQIFKGELGRFFEFSDLSLNKQENYGKIQRLMSRFSEKMEV